MGMLHHKCLVIVQEFSCLWQSVMLFELQNEAEKRSEQRTEITFEMVKLGHRENQLNGNRLTPI